MIRGLAGPYVILAQNFAPGTTAADIESAMTPVGGIIERCRLIKTSPIVIAEIVFENKEGADRVVAAFNGQVVSSTSSPASPGDNQLTSRAGRWTCSQRLPQTRQQYDP